MARQPRDTYRYTRREGNRIVYVGVTNDPDRRDSEHRQDGTPGKMRIEGPAVTRDSALEWERNHPFNNR